jgi:hypothetical protein
MLIMVVPIGGTGGTTVNDWPRKTNPANTRSHRLVPPLQHQIPWSTTGTTSPTEKLKAEDLGYPHELWIRFTAERVREENSSEGEDMASITRRSPDTPGTYTRCEHFSHGRTTVASDFLAARADCSNNGGRRPQHDAVL